MGKCQNCKVEVLDVTDRCPLCQSILEQTDELENMYPNARIKMRRLMFISRIYLFCAIIAETILLFINYNTNTEIWWSAITGVALLFGYTVLRYAILGKSNHKSKTFIIALMAVLCAVTVDFVIGYSGWSVDYVLPSGILVVDAFIIICMICNHRNWQSYIIWQIFMIFLSLIPIILFETDLERNQYMAFMPLAVSSAIFLGTMIIGDRRAQTELKRRFHIN